MDFEKIKEYYSRIEELILTTKKYSINQKAKLIIQIYEKNGGRDLTLEIPSNYILTF